MSVMLAFRALDALLTQIDASNGTKTAGSMVVCHKDGSWGLVLLFKEKSELPASIPNAINGCPVTVRYTTGLPELHQIIN